jgi:hypothetical protein
LKARNRTTTLGSDKQAIEGVQKDLQGMQVLHLGGREFTPTTLEDYIQVRVDAANAILIAKAAWLKAILTYEALDGDTEVVLRDLKRLVIGAFGEQSPKLADFGYEPPKQFTWTEAQKAAAVAKRAATRKARGTLGPKARLAITATTPGTTAK